MKREQHEKSNEKIRKTATWKERNMKRVKKMKHEKAATQKICNIEIAKYEKSARRKKCNSRRMTHEESSHVENCKTEKVKYEMNVTPKEWKIWNTKKKWKEKEIAKH